MRDLINIVEGAPTIKSVATAPGGNIDRKKADRVEDPRGFFKNAKHPIDETEELEEKTVAADRTVKMEWKVEAYKKDSGAVTASKDCDNNDEAWETAKGYRRVAGSNTGIRIIDITHTTVTTSKVRNIL